MELGKVMRERFVLPGRRLRKEKGVRHESRRGVGSLNGFPVIIYT